MAYAPFLLLIVVITNTYRAFGREQFSLAALFTRTNWSERRINTMIFLNYGVVMIV